MDIHFDGPFLEGPWNAGCDVSTLHPFCWGNDLRGITRWRWPIRCYEKVRRTSLEYSLDLPPHTVTVTIRIITFFDIFKPGKSEIKTLFTTGILGGGGVDLESIPNLPFTATHLVETLFPLQVSSTWSGTASCCSDVWCRWNEKKNTIFQRSRNVVVNKPLGKTSEKPLLLVGAIFFWGVATIPTLDVVQNPQLVLVTPHEPMVFQAMDFQDSPLLQLPHVRRSSSNKYLPANDGFIFREFSAFILWKILRFHMK